MNDTTIIITTRDRPDMLPQALDSALAQGCEVMVVDDGSVVPVHHAFIRNERPQGFIRARMAGLTAARTEYIAFLDDDDVLMDDWLALSRAKMDEGFDVVAASYWETDADLHLTRQQILLPATLTRLLSGHNPVNDTALVRRSVLEGVAWHPERDTAAMYSLWLELLVSGVRFGVVTEPCWYYRQHPEQKHRTIGEEDARWRAEAIAEARHAAA